MRSTEATKKLEKLIKGIQFAMLTTTMSDGSLRSRPMATLDAPFDGELWFLTDDSEPKVHEIEDDQHVNLSYADPRRNRYVSVSGRAVVMKDRRKVKELWTPWAKAWFPGGVDDPKLALLRVTVETAEYWDSPSSKVVQLYGLVKSFVTGKEPAEMTENRKIRLRRPATPTRRRSRATASRR